MHLGFSLSSLFDLMYRRVVSEAQVVSFVYPSSFFGPRCIVYIIYNFVFPSLGAFSTIAFSYRKYRSGQSLV